MPRYMVERNFSEGLSIPMTNDGAKACQAVVATNAADGVTWIHSYVNPDHTKTFCIYDAATPEAIRKSARANGLPADVITEVSVLDPYFYRT